jgi:hypothetical protein
MDDRFEELDKWPSGCARCSELALDYVAVSQIISGLIARQKLQAMRHRFEELEELDSALDLQFARRKRISVQMADHCSGHSKAKAAC